MNPSALKVLKSKINSFCHTNLQTELQMVNEINSVLLVTLHASGKSNKGEEFRSRNQISHTAVEL